LTKGQLLSEEEFYDAQDEFGDDAFEASIGAEAIKKSSVISILKPSGA